MCLCIIFLLLFKLLQKFMKNMYILRLYYKTLKHKAYKNNVRFIQIQRPKYSSNMVSCILYNIHIRLY